MPRSESKLIGTPIAEDVRRHVGACKGGNAAATFFRHHVLEPIGGGNRRLWVVSLKRFSLIVVCRPGDHLMAKLDDPGIEV